MLHKVLTLWNFWLYEVEKSKGYHTTLASIINNASERSGWWQMYATIYRNELWSRLLTVNIIHISAACSACRSHFSFPFIVPRTGLLLPLLLEDDEDATGRIVPPCILLEIESGACAMAFWHSKWAIKSLICHRRTADQLAANHKLYHTFCITDHWLKWQKTEHEYILKPYFKRTNLFLQFFNLFIFQSEGSLLPEIKLHHFRWKQKSACSNSNL
jgi:hypothetical protein